MNSGPYNFTGGGGGGIAGSGYGAMPLGSVTLSGLTAGQGAMSPIDEITHLSGRGMSIRVLPANGGIIISVRDENDPSRSGDLYVIGQDQDLGAEIGKIITMYYLKKE